MGTPQTISSLSLQEEVAFLVRSIDPKLLSAFSESLCRAIKEQRSLYVFGNGGATALAAHFVADLVLISQAISLPSIKASSLCENIALLTALANDFGYDDVFVRQLRPVLTKDDVVLGISTSGKSPSVLRALEFALEVGAVCLGLASKPGAAMTSLCHHALAVDSNHVYAIEIVHLCFVHLVTAQIRHLFGLPVPEVR